MIIDFWETEEHIEICFNYNQNKIKFPKHKIVFLLWNNVKSINLQLNENDKILNFKQKYEKYKEEYPNKIIFCFEFDGTNKMLDGLNKFLPANFSKFCNMKLFWYQVIIQNKIYEENIIFNLHNGHTIDINVDDLKDEDFIALNLETEIDLLKELNINLDSWEKTLKDMTLDNILLAKKQITHKYHKFHKLLDNNLNKQEQLEELIDTYTKLLQKQKHNIKNIPHSKIAVRGNLSKNKVIKQINQEIQASKNEKIKNQKYIHNLNLEIQNKKEYLAKLNLEINELEAHKNNKIIQNKNLSKRFEKRTHNFDLETHTESNYFKKDLQISEPVVKTTLVNLAVMIHLYNFSLWDEFIEYLDRLKNLKINYDLYVNIAIDPENNKTRIPTILEKVKKYRGSHNIYISYSDNRGLDIGGFFMSYLKMLEVGKDYFSIIKIHTKTNKNWRFIMLYSLLGNNNIIKKNIKSINSNNIGMIGYEVAGLNYNTTKTVKNYIFEYADKFKTPNMNGLFIPGTIFWIKNSVLKKYFNTQILTSCYQEFKQNYCGLKANKVEGKPHAFERFFGILVENAGYKTIKFDTTSS